MDLSLSNSTLMDLLNATANHDRLGQAAHRWYHQIIYSRAHRAMHNDTHKDSAHEFIVKFIISPSVCVAVVSSLAARSFAYHVHGSADSDKFFCYPWFVCHDKTLMHACSGLPPMINDLTSCTAVSPFSCSNTFLATRKLYPRTRSGSDSL